MGSSGVAVDSNWLLTAGHVADDLADDIDNKWKYLFANTNCLSFPRFDDNNQTRQI